MKRITKSFLLTTFSALALLACEAEPACQGCHLDPSAGDPADAPLVRFEVEVVGRGEVVVLEPEPHTCTDDEGLCSYRFPMGSRVEVDADFGTIGGALMGGWEESCTGTGRCKLLLDADSLLIANFNLSERPSRGPRPSAEWAVGRRGR